MAAGARGRHGGVSPGHRHFHKGEQVIVPQEIAKDAESWAQVVDYEVLPIWVNERVRQLISTLLSASHARPLQLKVACLVSGFLGLRHTRRVA